MDANVLYSAAYLERSGLSRLWALNDVALISSAYAMEEARRNLAIDQPGALKRLTRLMEALATADAPQALKLPKNVRLDFKDRPILLDAYPWKGRLYARRRCQILRSALRKAHRRCPGTPASAVFRTSATAIGSCVLLVMTVPFRVPLPKKHATPSTFLSLMNSVNGHQSTRRGGEGPRWSNGLREPNSPHARRKSCYWRNTCGIRPKTTVVPRCMASSGG